LVIISYTTGLSFALKRIGPLASIIIIVFYLLVLYLLALPNTPENSFASIYSESLIKIACQHLLLLIGFDTLIYRKYYDTPPILVSHQPVLSMGVAPKAIVEIFSTIGSSKLFFYIPVDLLILCNDFVGCAPTAPNSSSPRGYSRKVIFLV
jgi:hypothetical protein